jgi:hypothetical protein
MNNNEPGLVFRCQIYGRTLGMTGGFGAIDCKDYAFYHGLISKIVTDVTFTDVRHASTIVTSEQFSQRLLLSHPGHKLLSHPGHTLSQESSLTLSGCINIRAKYKKRAACDRVSAILRGPGGANHP